MAEGHEKKPEYEGSAFPDKKHGTWKVSFVFGPGLAADAEEKREID